MPSEISIIVPVFNEAENVLPLAREVAMALSNIARLWELIFVDDASTDATWERIREAHGLDARVIGLRHLRNAGQSAALWTGIRGTHSPIIATLDGDLQNDPGDIPKMLSRLDEYDFVSGMRVNRRDTFVRRVSSRIARKARRTMLGVDFQDTGCAMRVFKRSALEGVFPFNGVHRFLPILVSDGGAKTIEVPVNHRSRAAGISKYGIWNRLGRGIYDLIAIAWYQKRRYRPVPFARLDVEPADARSMAR
jgi:dolichol-phosphate mannosyltransferase